MSRHRSPDMLGVDAVRINPPSWTFSRPLRTPVGRLSACWLWPTSGGSCTMTGRLIKANPSRIVHTEPSDAQMASFIATQTSTVATLGVI